MKALTICQPVASAIIHGGKRIENRTWRPKVIPSEGLLVAVHAGKAWWSPDEAPTRHINQRGVDFCRERWHGRMPLAATLPTSAILGVMRVSAISPVEDVIGMLPHCSDDEQRDIDAWALGPWCWVIDRVWALPQPIPWARGGLSLWWVGVQPDVDRRLHELVAS